MIDDGDGSFGSSIYLLRDSYKGIPVSPQIFMQGMDVPTTTLESQVPSFYWRSQEERDRQRLKDHWGYSFGRAIGEGVVGGILRALDKLFEGTVYDTSSRNI